MTTQIHLGDVAVDSGSLRIMDACHEPTEPWETALIELGNDRSRPVPAKPLGVECGLDITGWGGDGVFPVTAELGENDGMIRTVTIHFVW